MKRIIKGEVIPAELSFIRPAGTSRGVYTMRKLWYIYLYSDDGSVGIGECAPLPQLSCDDIPDYADKLQEVVATTLRTQIVDREGLRSFPSMLFGLETAVRHLECSSFALWNTPFARGEEGIVINGLIWMGDYGYMKEQIEEKIAQGFRCIKLKIGAIDFEKELSLLQMIRHDFDRSQIELRVDANGAFAPDEALSRLEQLSGLDLHSIEQPIRQGQYGVMRQLCAESPLPIGFDEELIGVNAYNDKVRLLEELKPQYIILKPSLHGGISGCNEWIGIARSMGIGWWITSALESNVGLNAIAQYAARHDLQMPQGLGTGKLFTDNAAIPLEIKGDRLWFVPHEELPATKGILPL